MLTGIYIVRLDMLSPAELKHLQSLAHIKLTPDEEAKLGTQLDNIIQFLGQLNQIPLSPKKQKKSDLSLRTIAGPREFPDTADLLRNVANPLVNNSIVIKEVL